MRVSGISIGLHATSVIHGSSNRYNKLLTQASTQMKIQKGHEDPVLAQKAITLLNTKNQNAQYLKNIGDAKSMIDYSETVLGEASDMLGRVKELTMQASSDTITDESRDALVKEMDQLIKEFTNMGNQQFNGKYIFAGTNTTTKPFELEGNPPTGVVYHGNNKDINYSILDNYTLATNVTGDKAFQGLITDMIAIRDDIKSGDVEKLSTETISKLNSNVDNIVGLRTELGAKSKIADTTLERVKAMDLEVEESYSSLMGVDLVSNSIETKGVELSYQASLSIIGKLQQMSLINYL